MFIARPAVRPATRVSPRPYSPTRQNQQRQSNVKTRREGTQSVGPKRFQRGQSMQPARSGGWQHSASNQGARSQQTVVNSGWQHLASTQGVNAQQPQQAPAVNSGFTSHAAPAQTEVDRNGYVLGIDGRPIRAANGSFVTLGKLTGKINGVEYQQLPIQVFTSGKVPKIYSPGNLAFHGRSLLENPNKKGDYQIDTGLKGGGPVEDAQKKVDDAQSRLNSLNLSSVPDAGLRSEANSDLRKAKDELAKAKADAAKQKSQSQAQAQAGAKPRDTWWT